MNKTKFYSSLVSKRNFTSVHNVIDVKQKKILEDTFGRFHSYLRISLTERCSYCMPESGVNLTAKKNLLTTEEMLQIVELFVRQGVSKIRLTGGEPTVHKDLVHIVDRLRQFRTLKIIGMTTNGLTLTKQLADLQKAGLNALNVSLDTLDSEKFERITRRKGWSRVIDGIDYALQLGFNPVKVNCVVLKDFNDDEVLDFVELTKNKNLHVRFIEFMPFGGNNWNTKRLVTFSELLAKVRSKYPTFQSIQEVGFNETSKMHKVPGFTGEVGFISSITDNFCGSCNRLRLLADGSLKVCLLGSAEVSLRDALRNGCSQDDMLNLINAAVRRKKKQHAGNSIISSTKESRFLIRSVPHFITSGLRNYCASRTDESKLTHVSEDGKATMVDVGGKIASERYACAYGEVYVGREITVLIKLNQLKKGDVISISKLAGIIGAKKTSELIPLCHNVSLSFINVELTLDESIHCVKIVSQVRCCDKTGVEMEALTAVCVAALTVYDMCKAVSHDIVIKNVKLVKKTGGKADFIR
ncbi:molybdenum cofactor biosynthesis protein 1 isoform X2 [Planococcus citri]|uniref:molybdenum cofactor biosynthesis protein 1 isoform X2 n=1 Tax=Planococcus citri TaxID=170843 RepID=UPI0031F96CE7